MSKQDTLLGKQLDEYRLDKLLGHGGMARVYRGVDTALRRYVAIKVIDAQFRSDSEYARRFELEAQSIGQLDHPNVVSLYRYGQVDDLLYMAMQYIKGSDLRRMLDGFQTDNEYMDPQEALRVLREVGRGLDYIHKQGIIHRDLKPANIMLDRDGTAILTDFGLALMVDVGTRGEIFGTPHYISPEQAVSSAKVVPQSDIYALGVMMYEMFTNRVPFTEGEPLDIAMAHVSEPPPAPRSIRPDLSAAVEAVLLKALAKEASERYQTGEDLANALEAALKKAQLSEQETQPRTTILERVQLDMAAHPLPPIAADKPAAKPPAPPKQRDPSLAQRMAAENEPPAKPVKKPQPPPARSQQPAETVKAQQTPAETVKAQQQAPAPKPAQSKAAPRPKTAPAAPKKSTTTFVLYAIGGAIVALIVIIAILLFMRSSNELSSADPSPDSMVVDSGMQTNTAVALLNETQAAANATTLAQNSTAVAEQTAAAATQLQDNAQQQALAATQTQESIQEGQIAATQAMLNAQQTEIAATQAQIAVAQTQSAVIPSTNTAAPVQTTTEVTLFIYSNGDKAVRINNVTAGDSALNLAPLLLIRKDDDEKLRDGDSGNDPGNVRQVSGAAWGIAYLQSSQCLIGLKNANESAPNEGGTCTAENQFTFVAQNDENKAWDKDFRVYYGDTLIKECEDKKLCIAVISVQG